MPEDIPPIPANITSVMHTQTYIRIFFNELPQNEFDAYLELLESKGYSLKFIAYQKPYETKEEALAGGYDAVRAANGTYSVDIEYGNGEDTFDIDTQYLPEGTIDTSDTSPDWPDEFAGIIDPHEGCTIQAVLPGTKGSTKITCESESPSMLQDYMAELVSQGFEEEKRSTDQNGEIIDVSFFKDGVSIALRSYQPGMMGITVKIGAEPQETFGQNVSQEWPEELPASLPPYDGEIQSAFAFGDGMVKIMAGISDENDAGTYRSLLLSSGFTDEGGGVFSNADCTVTITEYMQASFFSIDVEIK
jgi:hypothetical protein